MTAAVRIAISPYARRLARERGIPLTGLRGSGPAGRIVAADVDGHRHPLPTAPVGAVPVAAIATRIDLAQALSVLQGFAAAGMVFDLDDLVLRAVACGLGDVGITAGAAEASISLEQVDGDRRWQVVLDNVRAGSLAPLRARRLAAVSGAVDQSDAPASLSIRLLPASRVRPVMMPLQRQRAMRLVLAPDLSGTVAECLLSFDPLAIDEAIAARFLSEFQDYLEVPLRLLA
jgi:pyruvate dehydrogenase E2 component (dihydrolipoamide acetyltransferase)